MKLLRFVMFLFYRYYSKGGTIRIPYFSALCATVFLIYIHVFQILIIFDKVDWFPMKEDDLQMIKYWKLAMFLFPIFIITAYLVKESDLKNLDYSDEKIKQGGACLILYVLLSVFLLFVLMFVIPNK